MDATATQNPHSSSATASNRQTTSTSPAARDLILTASNFIKNKRKNFSPRCSSTPEDDNNIIHNQQHHHHHQHQHQHHHHHQHMLQQHQAADLSSKSISMPSSSSLSSSPPPLGLSVTSSATTTTTTKTASSDSSSHHPPPEDHNPFSMRNQSSDLEAMSMHWRQLIANRCQTNPINTTTTIPVIDSLESNNSCLDTNQLYKIPNTNFTITKSQLHNKGQYQSNPSNYPSSTISGGCGGNSGVSGNNIVKSSISTTISPDYNTTNKVEFAYNAFTAVQELLNVYGLSISPGDIVEAFKKQNVGNVLQPPTPPRSPAATGAATITAIPSLTSLPSSSSSTSSKSSSLSTTTTTAKSSILGSKSTTASSAASACTSTTTAATTTIGHSNGIIGDVDNFSDDNNIKKSLRDTSLDLRTIQSNNNIKIEKYDDDGNCNNDIGDNDDDDEDEIIDENNDNDDEENQSSSAIQPSSNSSTNINNNNNNNNSNNNNNTQATNKSSTTSTIIANPSPPLITLAPVSKLMAIVPSQNFQQQQEQRTQKLIDLQQQQQHHHLQQHQQHQQQRDHKQLYKHNYKNDCDDTLLDDDDDDDYDDEGDDHNLRLHQHHNQNQQHQQQQQQHHQYMNSIRLSGASTSSISGGIVGGGGTGDTSSDQGNSPRPFDLIKINDDSNNSTIDQQHSDDHGSDDFGSNSTNQMDLDATTTTATTASTSTRLSVRNVENLLDKCSLGLFSPILQLAQIQNEEKHIHANNIKNLTKFSTYLECKNDQCQLENLREHYHCYDLPCFGKVLSKKEEIIRHLKWHKKRNESLNHGFLRFSASDDCSTTFGTNCTHNRKQTHYHCFQPNCDKVYISTSDVQMHSNYHRKDTAIFQEGFQRYRATEECKADYCMFSGQRTTHFHCRRDNCRFTFKNKADMEKHKSYHIKDSQLARDGFKKFLKSEACPYERCRFSRLCNHIHCVRENCHYVLHSSGQLLSHKRKHERMDSEQAYRRFKMIQKAALFGQDLSQFGRNVEMSSSKPSTPSTSSSAAMSPDLQIAAAVHGGVLTNTIRNSTTDLNVGPFQTLTTSTGDSPVKTNQTPVDLSFLYGQGLPIDFLEQIQQRQQQINQSPLIDAIYQREQSPKTSPQPQQSTTDNNVLMSIMANSTLNPDTAIQNIDDIGHIIQQCFTDNCTRQTSLIDQQNAQNQHQTEPLNLNLKNSDFKDDTSTNGNASSTTTTTAASVSAATSGGSGSSTDRIECFLSTNEPHMHCLIKDCEAVIPRILSDISDHIRMHELNRNAERIMQNSNLQQITSIEGYFNRKRGRPPKNRVVEVYTNTQQSPQAIFTSFKLEKFSSQQSIRSSSTTATPISQSTNNIQQPISDHDHHRQTPDNIDSKNQNDIKFRIFQPNEKCINDNCNYMHQMHFHCNLSDGCKYTTIHGQAMDQHMAECRLLSGGSGNGGSGSSSGGGDDRTTTTATILDGYQFYDVNNDCNIFECTAKRLKPHFHCNNCHQLIQSQKDLEPHSTTCCNNTSTYSDYKVSDKPILSPFSNTTIYNSSTSAAVTEQKIQDYGTTLNVAINNNNRLNDEVTGLGSDKTGEETDMDWNQIKSESSEDERVSVVRAAGTYFPENSDNTKTIAESPEGLPASETSLINCTRPFCKLKRKIHSHCELCNQGFTDKIKLKIHRLKHSTTRLGRMDAELQNRSSITTSSISDKDLHESQSDPSGTGNCSTEQVDQPQDLSVPVQQPTSAIQQMMLPQNFADSFSMQNLHLAHLALYQQNPFYYQNFYPFLGSQGLTLSHPDVIKTQFEQASTSTKGTLKPEPIATPFPFVNAAAAAAAAAAVAVAGTSNQFDIKPTSETFTNIRQKRKADDYASIMELLPAKKPLKAAKQNNFKIFKDEPIPHGYLKFRFNEDCNFPNCGYRNHQSHFHCCRNDCYYSFCDKTRFVQHTARHERLDKLMGDDFKQYRANMRCGYDDCAYNKNVAGQNNKSSHFHCLKCNYICSDTNKVVAHRRQHSKMEFIRMAGFRKVANNEKCTTTTTTSDHTISSGECSYSLKQTHYHCLVCDCSVLSRAQLGSHRHRVQ